MEDFDGKSFLKANAICNTFVSKPLFMKVLAGNIKTQFQEKFQSYFRSAH